jgi:multidrug efflux pump subunit AcrA (membrane-fusion protein)
MPKWTCGWTNVAAHGSNPLVYTVQPSAVIRIVPVTLGMENAQRVEVRSGLQEGDVVVVGRRAGLKDGQPVQIRLMEAQVH